MAFAAKPAIYTVGHSNRPIREFIALLRAHGIERIVDVRTIPRSRHNPQFNKARLKRSLMHAKIAYSREPLLGGLRRAKKDSVNLGWRNLSFRGFADYMGTEDFAKGFAKLAKLAAHKKTAIMCAEAVPWRCHRSLVADALKKRGLRVFHILSAAKPRPHRYTPFLKVRRGQIVYPG
jgi:uncharacterized protein (DUF488 family)